MRQRVVASQPEVVHPDVLSHFANLAARFARLGRITRHPEVEALATARPTCLGIIYDSDYSCLADFPFPIRTDLSFRIADHLGVNRTQRCLN